MEAKEFCYWLKGYFELLEAGPKQAEKLVFTAEQVEMIHTHLNYVFQERVMPANLLTPPYTISSGSPGVTPGFAIC
jgi:hypothetical protein